MRNIFTILALVIATSLMSVPANAQTFVEAFKQKSEKIEAQRDQICPRQAHPAQCREDFRFLLHFFSLPQTWNAWAAAGRTDILKKQMDLLEDIESRLNAKYTK